MKNRATIKDVAKEANVSPATISYVLNGKENISEETKARVYQAMEKLNYIPNLSARGLVKNTSELIGVVIPQTEPGSTLIFNNNFYSEIMSSIEYHARTHGYHVLISATDVNESYVNLARQRNLDGIIVIGAYPDDFFNQIKKTQIPVVLVDSYFDDHYFHSIQINDRYGGYIATKYLLEKGHRKIGMFTGKIKEGGVVKKRYDGYQDALKEYGLTVNRDHVFEGTVDFDSGLELAEKLVNKKTDITAIFCMADILAIGAMKGLQDHGIKIPDDISIVGFDDLVISKYVSPGLTTVHQNISQKGEEAVKLLLNSINDAYSGKLETILPISLTERNSVKQL
ncbi:MAG: LacI family transcriptional regulator [Clostridia bacterium]|nr:LacI family transcriptional regulator [Clostridia bacterium]